MTMSRRQILLKEAAQLFRKKGYLSSSLRELAKRAGIQGGSVYHHFGSKQEILFQVMDNTMSTMIKNANAVLVQSKNLEAQLCALMHFHIGYTISDSDETFITDDELRHLDEDNYSKVIAKRDKYQKLFEDIFTAGKEQGWQVVDPKLAARAAIQMSTGVSRWYRADSALSIDEIAEQYTKIILSGLLPREA